MIWFQPDLIHIDDDSEDVAEAKDNDNAHQDHGNAVVPLLPAGGLHVEVADVGDGSVDQAVGEDQNEEWKESHHEKVCKKDVTLDIQRVCPHGGGAYGVCLRSGVDDEDFSSFESLIFPFNTGVELVKPGDVPDNA